MPRVGTYKRWSRRQNPTLDSFQWSGTAGKADLPPVWGWTARTYQDLSVWREQSAPHRRQRTPCSQGAPQRRARSASLQRAVEPLQRSRRPSQQAGLQWACSLGWLGFHGASLGTAVFKPRLQTHSLLQRVEILSRYIELPVTEIGQETF